MFSLNLTRCDDDISSVSFRNGARVFFRFSDISIRNKQIEREMRSMGLDPTDVDVIISNSGNGEKMTFESLRTTAQNFRGSGKLILWLSNYFHVTSLFEGQQARTLADLGVVQFDMSKVMRHTLHPNEKSYCQVVENRQLDTHYCMPGPPDELGILLARMVWAHFLS